MVGVGEDKKVIQCMPRLDHHHDSVKRALIKNGWRITSEQFFIKLPERRLWIDLLVESINDDRKVLVEVKSYTNVKSPVESLAASVGKCMIYRAALARINVKFPVYLAVPFIAYQGIFGETIAKTVLAQAEIGLIVYDPDTERIVQWTP